MRISRLVLPALLPAALLAACGERLTEEQKNARRDARRTSCVAQDLAIDAKVNLASLDTALANQQGSPLAAVTAAAREFAAAYKAYADASLESSALLDSAVHAPSKDDSARLTIQSERARPPIPAEGTVQGNAAAAYRRDLLAALANPNHPCNVEAREKEGER